MHAPERPNTPLRPLLRAHRPGRVPAAFGHRGAAGLGALLPLSMLLLAPGCLRDAAGPFVGDCAEYVDDAYTFGEIGIGTCLAGPADVRFIEEGGETWLAVANADPYLNFTSGSFLLLGWDDILERVEAGERIVLTSEIEAHAQTTARFNGQFTHLPERDLVLLTNRLSPEAVTRTDPDRVFFLDVSNPRSIVPWEPNPVTFTEPDPYLVSVDRESEIAYVGNLTDHSITLWDLDAEIVGPIDVRPKTTITDPDFVDIDDSGSLATIDSLIIFDEELVDEDLWTLTFVDKLVRLWVPTPVDPAEPEGATGLVRWTSGEEDFMASALGVEVGPTTDPTIGSVEDPFVFADEAGLLRMFFDDGGVIENLVSEGTAADWAPGEILPFTGGSDWDQLVGGPSAAGLSATLGALYYDGRVDPAGTASIGVALTEDGLTYTATGDPIITDPQGVVSFEQPFVRADAVTNSFRMWMSVFDGTRWTIGLSESDDGLIWSPVEEVLSLGGLDVAAPTVDYVNGRYLMWFTLGDATGWEHATAWSYDGRTWFDVTPVVPSEVSFDPLEPPRLGTQADPTDAWRMEGRDEGLVQSLVPAGVRFVAGTQGLALTLASGQAVGNGLLPDNRSTNGLYPGSVAEVDGLTTLYVTGVGLDERSRIGVIRPVGDTYGVLESDVIPSGTGGNIAGASDPVVIERDGTWIMFYAAEDAAGVETIRRATSTDGRSFTPVPGTVVASDDDWDDVAQRPHSIEELSGGRVRLWYSGNDGNRWRIGAAVADDPLGDFTADLGAFDPWRFGTGLPGSFDDSGVKDPMVFVQDGVTAMYYAGFDGLEWHIGYAERVGGEFVRRDDPITGLSVPAMSGQVGSFSSLGVENPVLGTDIVGEPFLWYSGTDGFEPRLGEAIPDGEVVFAAQRFPTPGDFFTFQVTPGGPEHSNIELEQATTEFATSGIGMSSITHDPERGFLYVTSKLANFVYVIDVRDDSSGVFDDANFRDIEQLLLVESDLTPLAFRGSIVDPIRDRLYLTSRQPSGVVVLDLNDLVDDASKNVTYDSAVTVLPLLDGDEDLGGPTLADIAGDGMALTPDGNFLLVTHFRGNALWVIDLSLGAYGEAVAHLGNIGENPHLVRISPDGRYAVVANYLGDLGDIGADSDEDDDDRDRDGETSSTLAVVDIDPTSETYLEVVTWIANK